MKRGNIRPAKSDVKNPKIWGDLKSKIQQSIIAKETTQNLEFDLQRLMKERKSMENQEDENTDHLDYINNQIEETQRSLCDLTGILNKNEYLKKNDYFRRRSSNQCIRAGSRRLALSCHSTTALFY